MLDCLVFIRCGSSNMYQLHKSVTASVIDLLQAPAGSLSNVSLFGGGPLGTEYSTKASINK